MSFIIDTNAKGHNKKETKFQAVIATIQEELKEKYLKICTTYKDMTKPERKQAFMNYLLSSTHGRRLTDSVSQIIAEFAKEELHKSPNLIKQQLTMLSFDDICISFIDINSDSKLQAKLMEACNPVFAQIINRTNPKHETEDEINGEKIKPYLDSKNIENVYAEPLRDIETIGTLIEIALLNQDYQVAHKWITVVYILISLCPFIAFIASDT